MAEFERTFRDAVRDSVTARMAGVARRSLSRRPLTGKVCGA